jgi:hypothetical protein
MTGLYPIVRRARRPLIIEDDDCGPVPPPPPVPVVQEQVPVNYAKRSFPAKKGKRAAADASEQKQ